MAGLLLQISLFNLLHGILEALVQLLSV
jgi:hypothetical protein